MSFLDKQQDVIDIKLTQFGKRLLSKGKFRPVYYEFFDDGILYDSRFSGVTEKQNRSEERIFEAPRLKTQHSFSSVEKQVDNFEHEQEENLISSMDIHVLEKSLKHKIRECTVGSQKSPAFNLVSMENKIVSTNDKYVTEIGSYDIPQINFSSSYHITRDSTNSIPAEEVLNVTRDSRRYFDLTSEKIVFLDRSFLEVTGINVCIDLEELNSQNVLENFEFEVFEVHKAENSNTKETLVRLTSEEIEHLFDISIDEEVTSIRVTDHRNPIFDRNKS